VWAYEMNLFRSLLPMKNYLIEEIAVDKEKFVADA